MTAGLRSRAGWAVAAAAWLLAGCAALRGEAPPPEPVGPVEALEAREDPDAAGAAFAGVVVVVDAPGPIRTLLERHLDLVRLGRLDRGDVDDTEWGRLIDAAPVQVRDLLQTEGHFKPVLTMERERNRGEGLPDLVRLVVDPGPRARITRLTLAMEGDLQAQADAGDPYATEVLQAFNRGWALPLGSEFRNAAWSDAKVSALAQLRAAGYATATWAGTAAQVDADTHEVRLFLVADSGPLFRYGRLLVEGLVRHDLRTVNFIGDLDPGVPVTESLLLDFQERLQAAGLFESISVTLDVDAAQADRATVHVRLREASQQLYTFGVGVSANTGLRTSVEHVHRRLFGRALTARNKVEWGDKRQAWDGELSTHPGRDTYRNLLGGAVERLEGSDDVVLSQRVRVGRTQSLQRIERLYFVEAERSARILPAAPKENTVALSVNHHAVWRRLDNPVLPTEGYTLSAQGGVGRSRSNVSDTGNFGRGYVRLTGYVTLGRTWYGQARVEAGQVFVNPGVRVPESLLFRAGGDDSVRGYSYRSLGPQVGGVTGSGRVLFTSSVEVARPVSAQMPSLWGAVFVDAGNAADSFDELTPALGLGVGVRWRSPVGPLRLDWAWGREVRKARLHFSVGIAF